MHCNCLGPVTAGARVKPKHAWKLGWVKGPDGSGAAEAAGRRGGEEPQVVDNYHNKIYIPILGAANECGTLSAKMDTAATRKGKEELFADVAQQRVGVVPRGFPILLC